MRRKSVGMVIALLALVLLLWGREIGVLSAAPQEENENEEEEQPDTTAPSLQITYSAAHCLVAGEELVAYYGPEENRIDLWVRIEEEGELEAFSISLEGAPDTVSLSQTEAWSVEDGVHCAAFRIEGDGAFRVKLSCRDAAGNLMIAGEGLSGSAVEDGVYVGPELVLDTTAPDIAADYSAGDSYSYLPHGWHFSRSEITLTVTGMDALSGVASLTVAVMDEDGTELQTVTETPEEPSPDVSCTVAISLDDGDFRGTVQTTATDRLGNTVCREHGNLVESEERHAQSGSIWIETHTKPSRTVDGEDYYNEDVELTLHVQDSWSGLKRWSYEAGDALHGGEDYAAEAGTVLDAGDESPDIVYEISEEILLEAASNNQNGVQVTAQYEDNAGYAGDIAQQYHIDVTAPVITVEYDLDEPVNGYFYCQARTATVTIRERNFDAEDVEFTVTNTDGILPEFGDWESSGEGDDMLHTCQVVFGADGDYTFTVDFVDKAGNRAAYDRVDAFTIDRTPPVLMVSWARVKFL